MKKAIVFDGNSLFYRMYYATIKQAEYAKLNNLTPNNGIRLTINVILKYLENNEYEYYFVAFDHSEQTFRHHDFENYKKGRQKAPDDLYTQMIDTIDCLNYLGIKALQKPKIEADDLVGSFTKLMNDHNISVDVITSDKDLLQLVNQQCSVHLMKQGVSNLDLFSISNFKDKFFGLNPQQIIEYKAIVGDNSDNLPGINGIGPKTGIDLLLKYHDLDNIYNHLNELSLNLQKKFNESKAMAYQCRQLSTILLNELNDCQINDFKIQKYDLDKLQTIINKYHLKQLDEYLNKNKQINLF